MVGVVFQQLLADPRLPKANGVADQNPIVAGQNLACFLNGVFLKLG